ncbi:MAG: glycosyltransferase family 2 protein [Armatimonadota bacterium]
MPETSVCIVNWNTREFLRDCLQSLRDNVEGPAPEIIVVDNASTDGSAQMVRAQFSDVTLIALEENIGYAAGNNRAIEEAGGHRILLLNPDIVVQEGSVEALHDFLDEHPEAGAVAPRLLQPDGSVQLTCRSFPDPDVILYEALGLSRLFPHSRTFGKYRMSWWDYDDTRPVDQPMASALLIRSDVFDEIGLFDERFPIFFNDVDFCRRMWDAGWEIWFTPEAQMRHEGGASTRQVRRKMIIESHKSLLRYYHKHYQGEICPLCYAAAVSLIHVGLWVRLGLQAVSSGPNEQ